MIFATDVGVRDKGRFAGLPEITTSVKSGIHDADKLVARALAAADDPNAPRCRGSGGAGDGSGAQVAQSAARRMAGGIVTKLRTALLTGVSYMIPFVAAGGLLIALGFLLGGYEVALAYTGHGFTGGNLSSYVLGNYKITDLPPGSLSPHALFGSGLLLYLGAVIFTIGGWAFAFLVPALAGYIAFAIADRPGIAPGFVAGYIASQTGAGFIGGIVGGLLAGVVAHWFTQLKVPRFVRGLMPVVIIPLFTTLHRRPADVHPAGQAAVVDHHPARARPQRHERLVGGPARHRPRADDVLRPRRPGQQGGLPVRHRGPEPRRRRPTSGSWPRSCSPAWCRRSRWLSPRRIRPGLFTEPEIENGRAAWLLGASFISEGAIPFAAADPLRVIPAVMAGGAVTGALSELFHVGLHAPHGGIFVAPSRWTTGSAS